MNQKAGQNTPPGVPQNGDKDTRNDKSGGDGSEVASFGNAPRLPIKFEPAISRRWTMTLSPHHHRHHLPNLLPPPRPHPRPRLRNPGSVAKHSVPEIYPQALAFLIVRLLLFSGPCKVIVMHDPLSWRR
ncbi:hypothetical protein GALMADRAFT_143715 [Galerina marginata CBS 339.88]|uniref:Uncharacterized protein n=1 Tax=Galerina marginata (strain CBS 339.88) TaxID=685588 RepID=A0A067SUV7_GALM3|nr:hypothetical protein GALMADRAFT_143715 [Galerina marginata CBS 339.88]